jgi:PAS domain S-box-containing protein
LQIVWFNQASCKLWGYDAAFMRRGSLSYLLAHGEGADLDQLLAEVPTDYFEWDGMKRNGSRFIFKGTLRTLEFDTEPLFILSGRDITESRSKLNKSRGEENKYRQIFENAVIGIFQTSPEGHYLAANKALADIYGYASIKEMVTGLNDIKSQLYVEATRRQDFIKAMEENAIVSNFESMVYQKNRNIIWISENSRAVRSSTGRLLYYEGNVEDITPRKKAEFELARAKTEAEAANKAKSDFLATISHELRTPLNGIIGMTNIIKDTSMDQDQKSYMEIIEQSGLALLQLVNDVLDFSKVEAGALEFDQIGFDLEQTLETSIDFLVGTAESKGLELICQLPTEFPAKLVGDPSRLRQVILNLVGNAIKFTERGEVWITASVEEETPEEVTFCFSVRDTGIGIKPETVSSLFQPFVQGDTSTTRKYGGTGLGLAITKKIVLGFKGKVGVESKWGEGSTFWFTATFQKAQNGTPLVTNEPRHEKALVLTGKKCTGLILRKYLEPLGIAVRTTCAVDELKSWASKERNEWLFVEPALLDPATGLNLEEFAKPGMSIVFLECLGSKTEAGHEVPIAYLQKPIFRRRLREIIDKKPLSKLPHNPDASPELRILLAEDNPVNRMVALKSLKKFGFRADVAENGQEALTRIKEQVYDVILMDCQMPVLDGYGATRAIREMERSSPSNRLHIIALTANAMVGDREKCLDAGMDDYLSKPFKAEDLAALLNKFKPA